MSLENPEEKRAALEAINKHALSGIGARIEIDETGMPKIRETTVLSAVASTGQVESGDYISGMLKGDGSIVGFHDLPIGNIVQHLRGQPGSEITLLMERSAVPGGARYSFLVPVQRSLLVIQPPF
jgi:C-terminal processing protease CtpA/Prc